jgi:hydrogenase nickel incorporation protein HypA/HybF
MHEMSLIAQVHAIARGVADDREGGALESVTIAVGELAAVEPDLLDFAWKAIVAGGPDEGATLVVEFRPATQLCSACGEIEERVPGTWLRLCPACSRPLAVSGGDELDVISVSFSSREESEVPA